MRDLTHFWTTHRWRSDGPTPCTPVAPPSGELGVLDARAIDRVRAEARPDPRDPDELHDALLAAGFLTPREVESAAVALFDSLVASRRAAAVRLDRDTVWIAAERLPELLAVHPLTSIDGGATPPASRAARAWTREDAVVELIRCRLTVLGPATAQEVADSLSVAKSDADAALLALESEGAVLRGSFTGGSPRLEWCDRRLLARIHRYTLNRLRAEIEPVSPATFMRFLFAWQHVHESSRLTGLDGLRAIVGRLDGFELAASAWEGSVLPARMDCYEPSMMDTLCLTGEVGWARFSAPSTDGSAAGRLVAATPVALFLRQHSSVWRAAGDVADEGSDRSRIEESLGPPARSVLDVLRRRGASFARDIAAACGLDDGQIASAMGELVASGLVTSDGFAGLRSVVRPSSQARGGAHRDGAGRWSLVHNDETTAPREDVLNVQARSLLRRWGVVFRRLLAREPNAAPWRDLARVYRRLEARGEIRAGRFVSGMSGEQFALPEAVERLREIRRTPADGRPVVISAADPLNLTGVVTTGDRVRAAATNRILYRDGVPLAALEGDYMRPLVTETSVISGEVASVLAGRRVPAVAAGYIGSSPSSPRRWPASPRQLRPRS
jgi:ATP-dependent Lhr-like helicase